jgi:hypothetical protein
MGINITMPKQGARVLQPSFLTRLRVWSKLKKSRSNLLLFEVV